MKQIGRVLLISFWIVGGIVYLPLSIMHMMSAESKETGLFGAAFSYGVVLILTLSLMWYAVIHYRNKKHGESADVDWLGRKKKADDSKEFRNQVDNYYTLGITKSARGQLALLLAAMMLVTLLLSYFTDAYFSSEDALYSFVIYAPLVFFIYRGHRWAMFVMMIAWTFEKGYQLYATNGKLGIIVFFWWIWILSLLSEAVKIENARRKKQDQRKMGDNSTPISTQTTVSRAAFCSACGTRLQAGASFCQNCGSKIE